MSNNLSIALSVAVPLHIIKLKERGGPDEADLKKAREFNKDLSERGDVLLFGSKKKGEAASLFNGLARSIAVLSFCPGGVTLFGSHWEAENFCETATTGNEGDEALA
jgi:hypothetical protein